MIYDHCRATRAYDAAQGLYTTMEHFRATGAYEAVQGLSDLCNIRLQHDDVQDFDTRWDQALSSASEMLTENCLGRCVQDENTRFC